MVRQLTDALMAAVAAAGLAGVLLTARRAAGPLPRGRAALALAAVVGLAVAGALVRVPRLLPERHAVTSSTAEPAEADPLARLPELARTPDAPVLRARTRGEPPRTWPLLAYGSYDPATGWHTGTALTPLPATGDGVRVEVTLAHPARLLPHPPGVTAGRPGGLRHDARAEALHSATPAGTYTLLAAPPPRGGRPLTTPPGTACAGPELGELLTRVDRQAPLADQLAELEQVLAAAGSTDPATRPVDDGCPAVARTLGEGHGTSDQYATAFALAARMLGASSRVVAGFAPTRRPAADGTVEVVAGDAVAWPQIAYEGGGWVDYWPLPGRTAPGGAASAGAGRTAPPSAATRPPTPPHAPGRPVWPPALAATAALVLLAAATALTVRIRRRRAAERKAAAWWDGLGPRDRVLALWQRALRDSPLTPTPATPATGARTVAACAESAPLRALAALVDRALYAPDGAPGAAEVTRAAGLAAAVRTEAGSGARRPRTPAADLVELHAASRGGRHT